jgi:hypothetical protein
MNSIGFALALFATSLTSICGPAPGRVELRYRRPLGQVATFRLSLQVEGEQVSLGERRPVNMRAELELSEEVVAQERDGVLWLRVRARPVEVRDPTGTFRGMSDRWPEMRVRITPRGELLDVSPAVGQPKPDPLARAFMSLTAQPAPAILPPCGGARAGQQWDWRKGGATQTNVLVGVDGEGDQQLAHMTTTSTAPLELNAGSDALGLKVRLKGHQSCASQLDFLVAHGVVARQQGEMQLRAQSEITLALPEGPEEFSTQMEMRILFDLRLTGVR